MSVPFPEQRSQIRQLAAMILRRSADDWPNSWELILDYARQSAWRDLTSVLTARGYSLAQIERCDALPELLRDLTLFWVLTLAAPFTQVPEGILRRLDRRQELATLRITISGQPEAPADRAIRVGPPSTGT